MSNVTINRPSISCPSAHRITSGCLAFVLLSLVLLLSACGETEQQLSTNDNTEAADSAAAIALQPYPNSELEEQLTWISNNEDPVFADPRAVKGGMFRTYTTTFPLTLRTVGPDSNNQMRTYLQENQLSLVGQHPDTENIIPELATHWAYGSDQKTLYYRLNKAARWSDGKPITADDYLFTLEFMRSPHIVAPWYNNHYSTEIVEVKKYDDYTISITGATVKPKIDLHYYYGIRPTPRHFHKLDKNWVKNYNWEIEPNSGPYKLTKVRKGKFLEFELKQDWWAKDLKYMQHRFNIKRVRIKVIRDEDIAYKHFARGDLDGFNINLPKLWHDRAQGDLYDRGLINKVWFYNDIPRSPFGMYLNQDVELFADKNTRLGFAHAINMEGMIARVLRGDYERLPSFYVGYGDYSNTDIQARRYDLALAEQYFNLAGWDTFGPDGIRTRDGRRLSASITYGSAQHNDKLVFLKEEAKKAGLEIVLEQQDGTSFFNKLHKKTYQIAFLGFGGGYRPAYWQMFHSDNAHKPQTNNMTNTNNPEIDKRIMAFRAATEAEQRQRLSRELQQIIHDEAVFVPAYYAPYTRSAYWRWVQLPEFHATRKSASALSLFGSVGGLIWIDQSLKQPTLDAKNGELDFGTSTIIDTRYKVQ